MTDTRDELIAALESAEGPSRELDARIADAFGISPSQLVGRAPNGKPVYGRTEIPKYTATNKLIEKTIAALKAEQS